jgi:phosphate transport system permease protein
MDYQQGYPLMMLLRFRIFKDWFFKALFFFLTGLLMLPLAAILFYIIKNGLGALSLSFLSNLPKPAGEIGGGIVNALVGSGILIGLSCLISIPFGICVGIFLAESKPSVLTNAVKLCIDLLQGIPSIVIGIVAYAWIVIPMRHFSAFSGGVALSIMMLPLVVKSTEETLKLIPHSLKEASLALGVPYYRTVLKVILPTGFNGILTGVLLGIARVAGETAPLLFTAFGSPFMSTALHKPIQSLPLTLFNYSTSPYDDWQAQAWGTAFVLMLFILCLSLLAKAVTRK